MNVRRTLAISILLLACLAALAASHRLHTTPTAPATLPVALQAHAGSTPQAHVFVRSSCRSCRAHHAAMETALQQLPESTQSVMRSRIHLWELGKATGSEAQRSKLPVDAGSIGIRISPTTWFVSSQDSILQVWLGARSAAHWQSALVDLQKVAGVAQP
jgi:hypothetical protein